MEEPFVSVVTPFYNTAAFLAECIESSLAQSYSNFELVLVDNCSTDGGSEIAARYAARDRRVRVSRNERFLSQVQNYNHALRQISAKSRYCKLVQADDKMFPRCLTEMVALAEANPSVGVAASYRLCGAEVVPSRLPDLRAVWSGRDACRLALVEDVSLFGSPTSLLLRSDLVRGRDPFYDESRVFEDSDVVFEVLRGCDYGFVHQVLTWSRPDHAGSIWGGLSAYYPMALARILQLKTYGPTYLSSEEYERAAAPLERDYRRFLARAWITRREPKFWEFHRKGLATVHEEIESSALVRGAAELALQYAASPGELAASLLRRLRRRR